MKFARRVSTPVSIFPPGVVFVFCVFALIECRASARAFQSYSPRYEKEVQPCFANPGSSVRERSRLDAFEACRRFARAEMVRIKSVHLLGVYMDVPRVIKLRWPKTARIEDDFGGRARHEYRGILRSRNGKTEKVRGICRDCDLNIEFKFKIGAEARLAAGAVAVIRKELKDVLSPRRETSRLTGMRKYLAARSDRGGDGTDVESFRRSSGSNIPLLRDMEELAKKNPGTPMVALRLRPELVPVVERIVRRKKIDRQIHALETDKIPHAVQFRIHAIPMSVVSFGPGAPAEFVEFRDCRWFHVDGDLTSYSPELKFLELRPAVIRSVGWHARRARYRFLLEGGLYDTFIAPKKLEAALLKAVRVSARKFAHQTRAALDG